jgi:beta-glucanase (GH16 family)
MILIPYMIAAAILIPAAIMILVIVLASRSRSRKRELVLLWSDEFDGPRGAAPDSSKWTCETGGHGWGNDELETYTNRVENACLDGQGNLVITAIKETFIGQDGIKRDYTSARLVTKGKFAQAYGRFEARIKLPFGQGVWPAFWLLGDNIDQVGWADCGEIDILENIGGKPAIIYGSLHGPGYSGANSLTGNYTLPNGQRFSDDFHTFAIEWEPDEIRFYMDGNLYFTKIAADLQGKRWVFNRPFFVLLNVAIGGGWPGSPDQTTSFPQTMLIDYVRVFGTANR